MKLGLRSVTSESLHNYFKLDRPTLETIVNRPQCYYRSFSIEKHGKRRTICSPIYPLKNIQRALLKGLYEQVQWLECLHGGIPGRSIITNAQHHLGQHLVATFDISNFFPSTTDSMVRDCFTSMDLDSNLAEVLTKLVTLDGSLPQGAPTSMAVANLVLRPADLRLLKLCKKHGLNYTRYVDDIAISGMKDFRALTQAVRSNIEMVGHKVNQRKIRFSFSHQRQVVTGLVVNRVLSPTSSFISESKELIWRCRTEDPASVADDQGLTLGQLKQSIEGRVRYLRSVNPKKGRRLRSLLVGISWKESLVGSPGA
jgi:RNA-directed DNA polymerase